MNSMFYNSSGTRKPLGVIIILFLTVVMVCCKKEQEQYSNTGIHSFSFKDSANGNQCIAHINTDSNLIEVNWLYEWKHLENIEPVITLAPGATIEPASGIRVAFKDGTTYTVKAQNGTRKEYTLRKILLQSKPAFVAYNDSLTVKQGGFSTINVINVINDTAKTKIFLINRNTQVSTPVTLSSITHQAIGFTVPPSIEIGLYTLRLVTGLYTINAPVVYKILMPVPTITATNPNSNIKTGDNITFAGTGFGEIAELWCSTAFNGTYIKFPVVSQTSTSITVQVPAEAVAGTYVYSRLISPGTGTNSISLSASAKKFTVVQ